MIWCITHCSRETRKTVIRKHCRPRSGSPLFANNLAIFLEEYSQTYLKLKLNSSNVQCRRVCSVYNELRGIDILSGEAALSELVLPSFLKEFFPFRVDRPFSEGT